MPRYIDADKADKTLHDLLNLIKQERKNSKTEREWKRKSDIAAGIVLAIDALRDEPLKEVSDWVDDDSLPNEDMTPDNELIEGW